MSYSQILRRINRILKSQVEDVWDHLTKEKADLAAFDAELEGKKKTQSSDSAREADSRRAHANTGDAGRGDTHGHAGSGSTSGSTGAGSAGGRTAAGSRRTGSTSGGSAGNSPGAGSNRAGSGRDRAGAGSSGAGTGARSDEGRRKPGEREDAYYYSVLGLQPGAPVADIKRAYKRLMSEVHPDRVATLSAERQRQALEKAKVVNEAYQIIERRRGFK